MPVPPSGQGADALHNCPRVGVSRDDCEQQVCTAGWLGGRPEIRACEDPAPAAGWLGTDDPTHPATPVTAPCGQAGTPPLLMSTGHS
jgi:hypothetical protein